ncbi:hypothetical protein BX600DRAFT_531825 [Xylariales sp. PMI_506]|nr:hypothetical protein BX600DRAFT_531825 [Xylariales sp. PMI_506]
MQALCCYRYRCHRAQPPPDAKATTSSNPPGETFGGALPSSQPLVLPIGGLQEAKELTTAASRIATPSQLNLDLDILDSGSSETGDHQSAPQNLPGGCFGRIKAKVINHIVAKSNGKHQQELDPCHDQEELAWRAELKRLRQRRIQQELQVEDCHGSGSGIKYQNQEAPPQSLSHCLGKAQDTYELAISTDRNFKSTSTSALSPRIAQGTLSKCRDTTLRRCSSCPTLSSKGIYQWNQATHCAAWKGLPLANDCASPHVEAENLASLSKSDSFDSLRHKVAVTHLADYICNATFCEPPIQDQTLPVSTEVVQCPLRSPTPSSADLEANISNEHVDIQNTASNDVVIHDSPSRNQVESNLQDHEDDTLSCSDSKSEYQSPLNLWLQAQGIVDTSLAQNNCESGSPVGNLCMEGHSALESGNVSGLEISDDLPNMPGSFPVSKSCNESSTVFTAPTEQRQQKSQISPANRRGSQDSIQSSTSFCYQRRCMNIGDAPSRDYVGAKPSPGAIQRSQSFNPCELLIPGRLIYGTDQSEASSYITAPIHVSAPQLTTNSLVDRLIHGTRISTPSSVASSYFRREEELQSVAVRFASSKLSRQRSLKHPMVSRFREEFKHAKFTKRLSKLANYLPAPARPKFRDDLSQQDISFSDSHHNRNASSASAVPDVSESPTLSTRCTVSAVPKRTENVAPKEVEIHSESRRRLSLDQEHNTHVQIQEHHGTYAVPPYEPPTLRVRAWQAPSISSQLGTSNFQADKSSNIHEGSDTIIHGEYFEAAQHELKKCNGQGDTSNKFDKSYLPRPLEYDARSLSRIPASWAKWPSHTRIERNNTAGPTDRVVTRDFSLVDITRCASIRQLGASSPPQQHLGADPNLSKFMSISSKLGERVRGNLSKMIPGRRSTRSVSESLYMAATCSITREYPELELLPMPKQAEKSDALEQHLSPSKRYALAIETRSTSFQDVAATLPAVSKSIQQITTVRGGNDDMGGSVRDCLESLNTPQSELHSQDQQRCDSRAISGISQQFNTPKSHISYDDCVPRHMLD